MARPSHFSGTLCPSPARVLAARSRTGGRGVLARRTAAAAERDVADIRRAIGVDPNTFLFGRRGLGSDADPPVVALQDHELMVVDRHQAEMLRP